MGRPTGTRSDELRVFWRAHMAGWEASDLTQRQYCEAHDLSLKSFGNWRSQLKYEDTVAARKARWRRSPHLDPRTGPMTRPMTNGVLPVEPAAGPAISLESAGGRRRFSKVAKRQIVEESCLPGASVSGVARRYGIAVSLLFRWRQALGYGASSGSPSFAPVQVVEDAAAETPSPAAQPPALSPPTLILDRPAPGIEVTLVGGRRVRFDRDTDPETMCRLVSLLEGDGE